MANPDNAGNSDIDSALNESRVFQPPKTFQRQAHINSLADYQKLYDEAQKNPEQFWKQIALDLAWQKPFTKGMSGEAPFYKWFEDGKLNACVNCLDRHLEKRRHKTAVLWEGEPGDKRALSFGELADEVGRFANVLKNQGLQAGDRAAIYMPLVPEIIVALLACARLGITHNVIFAGFSGQALRERINNSQCKIVITADGGWRRGKIVELKKEVDLACEDAPSVKRVIVFKRTGRNIPWKKERDLWWHEQMEQAATACEAQALPAEHPLFILYTSGTTGKPKGIVHSTGGYLVNAAYSARLVFDLHDDDIYWCTADIGWITGHTYVLYGILANGITTFMYEGAPDTPDAGRFWQMIERYSVTKFYTAPTAIRAFMKWGERYPQKYNLESLKLLGSVGEPINPESWMWYHRVIGRERCPIVDTWWQTETGSIMISPLPGAVATKPGSATLPLPGIVPEILDETGRKVSEKKGGLLFLSTPWPSMARNIYGDPERFAKTYFSKVQGKYLTGDSAHQDDQGYFWIMGRTDDVLKISGHRLGTMEIESVLVSHPSVVEAAVVGIPDDIKGQSICAFVTLKPKVSGDEALKNELKAHVAKEIGAIARPEQIRFAASLPKTRSGKIMRRLLQEIAAKGEASGDQTSLEDAGVLEALKEEK